MKACLQPFNHIRHLTSSIIHRKILREFVMSKVSCDEMCNMDMIEELYTSVVLKPHHTSYFSHQTSNSYWFAKCIYKSNKEVSFPKMAVNQHKIVAKKLA